jgi:hypothetical protein
MAIPTPDSDFVVKTGAMTFLEAALEVLRREGKPLHFKDLTERAMGKKLLTFVGRTPEVTMQTQLTAAVKKAPGSPFVRVKPGIFGLLRYPELPPEPEPEAKPEAKSKAAPRGESAAGAAADSEAGRGRRRRRRGGRGRTRGDEPATFGANGTDQAHGAAHDHADDDSGAGDGEGPEEHEPQGGNLSAEARAAALAETGVLEGGHGGDDDDDERHAHEHEHGHARDEGHEEAEEGDGDGEEDEDEGQGDEGEIRAARPDDRVKAPRAAGDDLEDEDEAGLDDEPETGARTGAAGDEATGPREGADELGPGRRRRRRRRRRHGEEGGPATGGPAGTSTGAQGPANDRFGGAPSSSGGGVEMGGSSLGSNRDDLGSGESSLSGERGGVGAAGDESRDRSSAEGSPSDSAEGGQASRRIMTPVDAAIEILRGQAPGRGVHVRQIADAAARRRLVHGEPNEAWRVMRTALAAEPRERLRAGQRPRVRPAGSGLFALARRPPDSELERAEQVFGEARRALRERTVAALERRIAELPAPAFEALARVILQREGFGPATFVKRVEGTIYVEALRGRGTRPSRCLVGLRPGATSAGRRAIGELRAGIRARNQDEGVLLLGGRLAEDAIAEWKQPGPPVEIADGQAVAETCIRHGVGVINTMVSVDFVDADFFAELSEG